MPLSGKNPELNFAQQVSFVDSTSGVNVTPGEAADRGVVEVQLAVTGTASGSWIKIYPYVNVYDQQGTDDFTNCVFDPVDDGNNEDSFTDPTDPNRRLGPSSTCFPEFTFVRQGQTDYRKQFDVTDIGAASDGPGLQGCSGAGCLPANTPLVISNPGTWVRPRFSLVPFAGREIRLRFLYTSIEIGVTQTMDLFFGRPDTVGDDGWYIDDIHIDQALGNALTLSPDTASIVPIPCGTCASVTAVLTATPNPTSGPGQVTTLSAKDSAATGCIDGIVQFKFFIDVNLNGSFDAGVDTVLRDWTDNSTFVDAPGVDTAYGVQTRCSTNFLCHSAVASPDVSNLLVTVGCPQSPVALKASFNQTIKVNKVPTNATIVWPNPEFVFAIKGDLTSSRFCTGAGGGLQRACYADADCTTNVGSGGGGVCGVASVIAPATLLLEPAPPPAPGSFSTFNGTVISCLANDLLLTSVTDAVGHSAGQGVYYLVRGKVKHNCNEVGFGYTTQHPRERVGRDAQIFAAPNACP
jgi:hypothetical protein